MKKLLSNLDWKNRSIEPVPGLLKDDGLYLLHAQAFGIKGLAGGRHSWMVAKSGTDSLVAEITDLDTIDIQDGSVLFGAHVDNIFQRAPMIVERCPNQRWFGAVPVVDCYAAGDFAVFRKLLFECVEKYPFRNIPFRIIHRNCNTFTSWVVHYAEDVYGIQMKPKKFLIGSRKWRN